MTTNSGRGVVRTGLEDLDDGLDGRGRIRREGDLGRIDAAFTPLVSDTESALKDLLGRRLHSIYLYGSVPRGTAAVGVSDLDVEVVLRDEPTDRERADIKSLSAELDQNTSMVDEVGIIVDSQPRLLSPGERYDNAFQISCLCTPLWGPDLAAELPDQYPTIDLARGITSGTESAFARLAAALNDPTTPRPELVRQRIGRRITRLAFVSVLFRWPGWTSDPNAMRRVVSAFYPEHSKELATSIRLGWGRLHGRPPTSREDHDEAGGLLESVAPWWMAEYIRVTGATA